jgi:Mg-chelatase subunit ChlD
VTAGDPDTDVREASAVKTIVGRVQPGSGTNIYDGLQTGYKAALSAGDETPDRRVFFLTDGLANQGIADAAHDLLVAYQPKLQARIAGWADQDLLDDLTVVQQYVDVLAAKSASH